MPHHIANTIVPRLRLRGVVFHMVRAAPHRYKGGTVLILSGCRFSPNTQPHASMVQRPQLKMLFAGDLCGACERYRSTACLTLPHKSILYQRPTPHKQERFQPAHPPHPTPKNHLTITAPYKHQPCIHFHARRMCPLCGTVRGPVAS